MKKFKLSITDIFRRDFTAPLVPSPRPADSSAATIAATGLLLLSRIEDNRKNSTGAKIWSDLAISVSSVRG